MPGLAFGDGFMVGDSTVIANPDDRTITVSHNGATYLDASMPYAVQSYAVSGDGALALICLANGHVRVIY